jgi:hypothetical protein
MSRYPYATLCLAALAAQACMLNPQNGQQLPSTTSSTTFSGYWAAPLATITLQSAASPWGPFQDFASAKSGTRAQQIHGAALYPWSVTSAVPGWSGSGCATQVFVRALDSLISVGGSVHLSRSYFVPASFTSLVTVGGDLTLRDMAAFVTVPVLNGQFPALTLVDGTLDIDDGSVMDDLLLGETTGLTLGGLRLHANPSLAALTPPHISVAGSGPIEITDNPLLCTDVASAFVAAQTAGGWSGTATASGNANCP